MILIKSHETNLISLIIGFSFDNTPSENWVIKVKLTGHVRPAKSHWLNEVAIFDRNRKFIFLQRLTHKKYPLVSDGPCQ